MGRILYTADLHLGHANIMRHCDRPFASVDEMDAAIFRNWQDTVCHDDVVYIVGDVAMTNATRVAELLNQVNHPA